MMASATKERTVSSSFSPKAGTSKRQRNPVTTDASPDSKCPICLDRFDNVSYLDRCLHRFCFRCIQEWSKNKAECPLCKQPFHSIFHSVRAEDDFKEYILRPSQNGSFASPDGHRFRYRTTLTRERRTPVRPHRSTSVQRTLSPPDNGVLFEGLVGQTNIQRDEGIHQIRRFASRRQTSTEGRSSRHVEEQDIINFRRALYRSGVRVRNIQDGGRYRDISAEFFRCNPACLHRLIPWLKRELLVLFGAHGSLVNIVQHIIMSNVTRYDLESQTFADDLKPFLLHRTDHFLHEFISFARCPYNIDAYDLHANYDYPAPSYEEGSHSDSSVITISPDECDSRDPDLPSSVTDIGQTPWDDETPGPSYSTLEPAPTTVSSLVDTSESSDEEPIRSETDTQVQVKADPGLVGEANASSTDDCVIVGFIKPLVERTPELVELSSDSEDSLYEEKTEDNKKLQTLQLSPFSENSESSTSSSPSSTSSKGKKMHKTKQKQISSFSSKFGSLSKEEKDKGRRRCDLLPSKNCVRRPSTKRESSYIAKKKERSRSPNPVSHFTRARDQRNRRKHHSKERHRSRSSRSWESTRHRDRRDDGRLMTRDRSLSRRSQTVSLTSESSMSREEVRSGSRSSDRGSGRSRSRDSDYDYPADNYRRTYRWEYTYYSRNRERDGFDRSCKRKTQGKGYYQRRSTSPEFRIQHYSERKHTQNQRCHSKSSQYYQERFRSRSHSSNRSRMTVGGAERTRHEKPSGKRKYKSRHLEHVDQVNKTSRRGTLNLKGKENRRLKSPLRHSSRYNEDDLSDSRASSESRHKRKKKARSSSVEIVYEGKTASMSRHHKKKKKKQKKKHKRHHAASSALTSPVVITINSDSESEKKEDMEYDDGSNWAATNLSNDSEREAPTVPAGQRKDMFDMDLVSKDDHCSVSNEGGSDVSDKDAHTVTSNMNLEAATGILDDFHFDESSNEQTFTVVDSIGSDSGLDTSSTVIEGTPAEQPTLSSSTRNACEENSLERPQLILRLPKSLIEKNYLFDRLGKKT